MKDSIRISTIRLGIIVLLGCLMSHSVRAGAISSDVLCPTPEEIASIAPADLAQVQNDIDRYSLCVKRARLLQQMDNLIKERLSEKENQQNTNTLPDIPPLSKTESIEDLQKMLQNVPANALPPQKKIFDAEIENPDWYIKKMWGRTGKIHAQLAKEGGLLTNVIQGDILSDGWEVVAISLTGVTVRKNGVDKNLDWIEVKSNEDTIE